MKLVDLMRKNKENKGSFAKGSAKREGPQEGKPKREREEIYSSLSER